MGLRRPEGTDGSRSDPLDVLGWDGSLAERGSCAGRRARDDTAAATTRLQLGCRLRAIRGARSPRALSGLVCDLAVDREIKAHLLLVGRDPEAEQKIHELDDDEGGTHRIRDG